MSYALSASLQAAVYQRLLGDAELGGLVGTAIYDAPLPVGAAPVPEDYVTLGVERVRANDTFTSRGAVHDFVVAVHSGRDGFDRVKRIAAAVCESLVDAPLALHDGWLVALRFLRASAERGPAPEKRRVALQFRAVVEQAD
jgi:hypothetical protein